VAQLQALTAQVEALKPKDPQGYTRKNATKRLTAIRQLAFEVTPQDPVRPEYQQGHTLGDAHRHWFRFHAASHIIVLAWVNDEDTRRTIGMICWHKPAL
jgi:toxin YhaV